MVQPNREDEMGANAQALLEAAAAHYHVTLKTNLTALTKLRWRGESARALIEYFRLGYANGTLEHVLGAQADDQGKARRAQLREVGLIKWSGRELFKGAIVIPVHDASGQVRQMCGAHHISCGRNTPDLYLPGFAYGLFHPEAFMLSPEVIVAPYLLDALRFWYAGHPNVTASTPDLSLTPAHFEAMARARTERVLLAFDAGDAGDAAAFLAAGALKDVGIEPYRVPLGRRWKPTSKCWGLSIRRATPMLGAPPRPEPPPLPPDWQRPLQRTHKGART